MNHVASSWTVIFTSHFHHNYNGTTSRDSNVEYNMEKSEGMEETNVQTHDGLCILPFALIEISTLCHGAHAVLYCVRC